MIAAAEMYQAKHDEQDSDENPWAGQEEDDEVKWDCETILSTYTNTDNHPGVIKTQKRIRPSQKMKIELHKAFRVPVDGLMPLAEEITIQKDKKREEKKVGPYLVAEKTDDKKPKAEEKGDVPALAPADEKAARKQLAKE